MNVVCYPRAAAVTAACHQHDGWCCRYNVRSGGLGPDRSTAAGGRAGWRHCRHHRYGQPSSGTQPGRSDRHHCFLARPAGTAGYRQGAGPAGERAVAGRRSQRQWFA